MQAIAWVLGHVSASDIVMIIHALTLHKLCAAFTLELRVGKRLIVKVSKPERPERTR